MNSKYLISILYLLAGCVNNNAPKVKVDSVSRHDIPYKDVYSKRDTDTNNLAKNNLDNKEVSSDEGSGEGPDLQSIFNDYIGTYKKPCVIDTAFSIGTDRYTFHAEHECLMDSGITVPKDYVYMYKLDSFVTHNFLTHVRLAKNDKSIVEKTIYKKNFDSVLRPDLKRYAVLFCPYFLLKDNRILLHYSVSIPLTDVGIGAYADMDGKGNIVFRNDR